MSGDNGCEFCGSEIADDRTCQVCAQQRIGSGAQRIVRKKSNEDIGVQVDGHRQSSSRIFLTRLAASSVGESRPSLRDLSHSRSALVMGRAGFATAFISTTG